MDKHFTILAVLNIALAAFGLLGAGFVFLFVAVGSLLSGDAGAIMLGSGLGTLIAGFITALSLPSLIAGIGLLKRRSWARIVALLVGALNLINVPFGPVLTVYTIWVFLQDESEAIPNSRQPETAPAA